MAIDPIKDTLISTVDVAKRFPRGNGRTLTPNSVRRWVEIGYRGVKLEAIHVGASLCTTEDCLRTFLEAINPQSRESAKLVSRKADVEAEQRQSALEAELAELGIPSF